MFLQPQPLSIQCFKIFKPMTALGPEADFQLINKTGNFVRSADIRQGMIREMRHSVHFVSFTPDIQ